MWGFHFFSMTYLTFTVVQKLLYYEMKQKDVIVIRETFFFQIK